MSFSNDEQAAQRGVWIMGIAAPPQVRRVVDHAVDAGIKRFAAFAPQTSYGQQMVQTMESQVTIRGGKVAAIELFDANSADLDTPARRLAEASRGEDKLAVLVPVAPPRLAAALAALAAAGIDNKSVQLIGTGVWDVPNIGSEVDAARRLVCRARPGQAGRLRAAVPVDLRPAAASPGDARL